MNWHYAEAGQQRGPVTEEELLRLAESGKIQPDTLVWHEGWTEWQPYGYVKPSVGTPPLAPPVPPAVALGVNEAVCVACGKVVLRDNAIFYSGNWVCADCKPVYFQKVKEGAPLPFLATQMAYAGFWIRFGAKFIDWLVLGAIIGIPAVIIAVMTVGTASKGGGNSSNFFSLYFFPMQLLIQFASIFVTVFYNWFFLKKYGATLGKMACGLKVVAATGSPLSSGQALGRAAAEILSQIICYIGYILAAFDGEKRALHDHIAGTRVIRK